VDRHGLESIFLSIYSFVSICNIVYYELYNLYLGICGSMINWHQSLVYLTLSYKIRLSISLHVFSIEHHIMYQLTSQIEFIVQHLNKIAVGQYLLQNSLSTFNLPLDSGDKSV